MPRSVNLIDVEGRIMEFDTLGNGEAGRGFMVSADVIHHKIHEGKHFFCMDYDADVDTTETKKWIVKCGTSKKVHFVFQVVASKSGTVYMHASPTVTAEGTELTVGASNQRDSETALTKVFKDPTTSGGTLLKVFVLGTDGTGVAGGQGGTLDHSHEVILDCSKYYQISFVPTTDNTRVSLDTDFYEVSIAS